MKPVNIIGGGLAGSEAAWQLVNQGIPVRIYEMRGTEPLEPFTGSDFAELVCSNSLRSDSLNNAAGILKEEMRKMHSLILEKADEHRVPAGSALAVDRTGFSKAVTETLENHPLVEIVRERVDTIPEGPTILASGPLTHETLSKQILGFTGQEGLHFFDAVAPIVSLESVDMDKAYFKSRYDKGEAAYLNCAMDQEQYDKFYEELINAKCANLHEFEKDPSLFEGCMPVEEMARRGKQTLLFGPLKPVGLEKEGEHPVAVVQLRQDNAAGSLYNLVGFQTHLTWPEQKRVFSMIPGLENAEFIRYGVMHRNTFINSPMVLNEFYQAKNRPDLFFAGQLTGVEGYLESAASGLIAGVNMARFLKGDPLIDFTRETVMGSQANYISHANSNDFQPMNANFGILEPIRAGKKRRREMQAQRALEKIAEIEHVVYPVSTQD